MPVFNVGNHWLSQSPQAARHEEASDCWITCDILGLLFSQLIRYLNQVFDITPVAVKKCMPLLHCVCEYKSQRSAVCVLEQIKDRE